MLDMALVHGRCSFERPRIVRKYERKSGLSLASAFIGEIQCCMAFTIGWPVRHAHLVKGMHTDNYLPIVDGTAQICVSVGSDGYPATRFGEPV